MRGSTIFLSYSLQGVFIGVLMLTFIFIYGVEEFSWEVKVRVIIAMANIGIFTALLHIALFGIKEGE